ncbi:MAG TPA: hypothetical protein VFB45_01865 [Pseudolabrys sp.]|nr:hypothetical protein [Pseudolabrys sp.]
MRINHIAEMAFEQLFGRLLRRAIGVALVALFALIALYHFTVAGTLALEAQYGLLTARLIVAVIYTLAALVTLLVLWSTRNGKLAGRSNDLGLASTRGAQNTQLAMLVEAVLIGYSLARRAPDERPR